MLTPDQISAIKEDPSTATPQEIIDLCEMCEQAAGGGTDDQGEDTDGPPKPPADPRMNYGGGGTFGRGQR